MSTIPLASVVLNPDRRECDESHCQSLADSISETALAHPIVIDENNVLIAGRHRLRALEILGILTLEEGKHFTRLSTLTPLQKRILELEENVKRKQLSWQEKTVAIADFHNAKIRETVLSRTGEEWLQESSGQLLGVERSNVSYALTMSVFIKNGDKEICEAKQFTDALKIMMKRREENAMARLRSLVQPSQLAIPREKLQSTNPLEVGALINQSNLQDASNVPVNNSHEPTSLPSFEMVNADCMNYMRECQPSVFDHIVSDPPYGIDMEMLEQENTGMKDIDRIVDTHDVESNLRLFDLMIPEMYRVVKSNGFVVLWCDVMNFVRLHDLMVKAGFKVCRWPLTWIKTHRCMNQSAQYNFTKSTEIAIIARKGNAILTSPQPVNYIVASNDRKEFDHPFVKPDAIWSWIYKAITIPGQTVFDPFAGVGSSCCSAIRNYLIPVGCELDPRHHARLVENVNNTYIQSKQTSNIQSEYV
jgi:DNA modification methylase